MTQSVKTYPLGSRASEVSGTPFVTGTVSVGIVGGGSAGLSLARFLSKDPMIRVTIFESNAEPGGKSLTLERGGTRVEMGTGYTTTGHKIVLDWMDELGIGLMPVRQIKFDGADFEDFVAAGPGPPTVYQLAKYLLRRRAVLRGLTSNPPKTWAQEEAAMPVTDWLEKYNLPKVYRLFLRGFTNMGYGFLDTSPTLHVMRWMDWHLIWSGLRKKLQMPRQGWSEFWRRVGGRLDVRLSSPVQRVSRQSGQVKIVTADNKEHVFDHVVCAIPVDDFVKLTNPTDSETYLVENVRWNSYTTTLFASNNWFQGHHIESYSAALVPGAKFGRILSARHDGSAPELGGELYLSGQFSGDYDHAELVELLRQDLREHGAEVTNVIFQQTWKYHAEYAPQAIKADIVGKMRDMQGDANTWYTGATFSHESINHIVNFNKKLAQRMVEAVYAQPKPEDSSEAS